MERPQQRPSTKNKNPLHASMAVNVWSFGAGFGLAGWLAAEVGARMHPYLAGLLWLIAWFMVAYGLGSFGVTRRMMQGFFSVLAFVLGLFLWQETSKHSELKMDGSIVTDPKEGAIQYRVDYSNEKGLWPARISIVVKEPHAIPDST